MRRRDQGAGVVEPSLGPENLCKAVVGDGVVRETAYRLPGGFGCFREMTEREMHGGAKRGESHVVLALFDGEKRISEAEVTMHVTLAGGPSVTRRLQPMTIAGQPGFGAFVSVGTPGIYRIRFEVRRPGHAGAASAQFEHRVSPEGRR